MKTSVTHQTIKRALLDLEAQLVWIEDPSLRDFGATENKKEIKILKKTIAFLQTQLKAI